MSAAFRVDVAILGGGIAGLWLLARLHQAGYRVLLLERDALGAGQTIASQGIIHGGLKYAIDLKLGGASEALADMPRRWRASLEGHGEVDLRDAEIAAERHLFWSRRSLASRITGFFGSKLVQGRTEALDQSQWPVVLRDSDHVGAVYTLDEIVLDIPKLLRALSVARRDVIKKVAGKVELEVGGDSVAIVARDPDGQQRRIQASHLIASAGAGNEAMLAQFGLPIAAAQRRPLQMVMIGNAPGPLWAHCFDVSDKPRVTVTTHRQMDGTLVWYVGGQLAESGAGQCREELIAATKAEFSTLLPALDLSTCRFATLPVDRAEGATESGGRPDGPVLRKAGRVWFAWPTKLALAPHLADLVMAGLPPPGAFDGAREPAGWQGPEIAKAPWETARWS